MENKERIAFALQIASNYGGIDGDHHKAWVIDQMVRALTGCVLEPTTATKRPSGGYSYDRLGASLEYEAWVRGYNDGDEGAYTYEWQEGIAP